MSLSVIADCYIPLSLIVSISVADFWTAEVGELLVKLRLMKLAVELQQIVKDTRGQDLIEYTLLAGFVAVAVGATMPDIASSINVVFSKVNSIMISAASS